MGSLSLINEPIKFKLMSTRAGIIIKDKFDSIHFYRHSDGYPEGTLPTLKEFLDLVKSKKIRNNTSQASGWLVIIGAKEYNNRIGIVCPKCKTSTKENGDNLEYEDKVCPKCGKKTHTDEIEFPAETALSPENDWKVGAYEPTKSVHKHGDLEYIYTIDLDKLEITYKKV